MPLVYCICALFLLQAAPALAQQPATGPARTGTGYAVFLGGIPLGREEVSVRSDASGTTITSSARFAAPLNLELQRAEVVYRSDWSPVSLTIEGTVGGGPLSLRTAFSNGNAVTEGMQGGRPVAVTHPVSPQAVVLPNIFFGAYVALARRLADATPSTTFRVYIAPVAETAITLDSSSSERMQVGTTTLDVRRYNLTLDNAGRPLAVTVTVAEDGTLLRLNVPSQSLNVVREDLAASTSRMDIYSNPGDEAVVVPATGFSLGATLTMPRTPAPAGGRRPAVILHTGSGVFDRDGVVAGVPTLGQMAGALADAGFIAIRYDKRGHGQSGGRSESATISDYADDAVVVAKWLAARRDVDPKRIAVVGHSEGAFVALLASARDRRLSAVVTIAAPAVTGAELILEQQRHALDATTLSPAERDAKVALQKQVQAAVLTGRGWEGVDPLVRAQADTPWFQSLLAYDPAKVITDVRQPLLIVHGQLDRQVPVEHADKLAALARTKSKSKTIEVVVVRGVNHLMVPATTGEVSEYGALKDRTLSPEVTGAIAGWLTRTFAAIR